MVIFPLKVLNVSNRGRQTISKPFGYFVEGLFIFLNFIIKKEGLCKFV